MVTVVGAGWLAVAACAPPGPGEAAGPAAVGALVAPVVGPVIGTDTPVPVRRNVGHDPDVASDGSQFLVAFEDQSIIHAVRVSPAGTVLDLDWLGYGEEGVQQFAPSVAFGGGRYLMTWWQIDAASTLRVFGRLLGPDGAPQGASFPISSGDGLYAAAAWNGARFVVAWLALGDGGNDIHVALVDGATGLVAGSERAASTNGLASLLRLTAAPAAGGGDALVAWEDRGTGTRLIRAARIAAAGTVRDPGGVRVSGSASFGGDEDQVELAAGSGAYFLAWRAQGGLNAIRGARIAASGAVTVTDVALSAGPGDVAHPSVAFDGTGYLVAWKHQDEDGQQSVVGRRVSAAGAVAAAGAVRLATGSPRSLFGDPTALGWNGSRFLLAFLGEGIEGSLIAPNLSLAVPSLGFSVIRNQQSGPQVTWNGHDYVVAWIDERNGNFAPTMSRALRVSPAGQVLDPAGIQISGDENAFNHSLASTGTSAALIAWSSPDGQGRERTIGVNGMLGAAAAVTNPGVFQSTAPSLASNGQGYLLVTTGPESSDQIGGQLLNPAGNAVGPAFVIQAGLDFGAGQALPAGRDYLVASSSGGAHVIPVSRTGQVGASIPLTDAQAFVNGASDGTSALVVWVDFNDGVVRGQIYSGGALTGAPFVISETSDGFGTGVGWDGANYLVVWENPGDTELQGRSVGGDGTLGPINTLVNGICHVPGLASDGRGQLMLTCYHYEPPLATRRVVSRLIRTFEAPPAPDAGAPAADAGAPASDAGMPAADAGAPASDAGAPGGGRPRLPPILRCSVDGGGGAGGGEAWWAGAAAAAAIAIAARARRGRRGRSSVGRGHAGGRRRRAGLRRRRARRGTPATPAHPQVQRRSGGGAAGVEAWWAGAAAAAAIAIAARARRGRRGRS